MQQRARKEPGTWWVKIQDMPLSIADIRNGIAVLPDWNQNGNLEFFVVPEGSDIQVIDGNAASQRLLSRNASFHQLQPNEHFVRNGNQDMLQQANGNMIPLAGAGRNIVTNQWLQGGCRQIFIINNRHTDPHNPRPIFGDAFYDYSVNHYFNYVSCIALIETGFDVETQ
jgi:hypothetical protein